MAVTSVDFNIVSIGEHSHTHHAHALESAPSPQLTTDQSSAEIFEKVETEKGNPAVLYM